MSQWIVKGSLLSAQTGMVELQILSFTIDVYK